MIRVNHISKRYGKKAALSDVSLSVAEGEIFGLIGPDGAGKTSLFSILATLLQPDEGTATIGGLDLRRDYLKTRRSMGYMPARFALYPDLTVRENLDFFASLYGTSVEAGYHLIEDIYSQIEPFSRRQAGKLSGGMKQKLALCCCLVHAPRLLLLDEPTTGVDPVSRKEFWASLGQLSRSRGITIVVATPYMDEIRRCDRIAFIHEGRVKGVGTPDEIIDRFSDTLNPPPIAHAHPQTADDFPIVVDGLVKQFGDFRAVDGISFKVRRGEIFGFLGANGAGKTTAMRILCGLSQPTAGRATVAGFDVATQHEQLKRNIGYMSQKFSLYDDLTVQENLRLFGAIYGMGKKEIEEKSASLLGELGLGSERHAKVGSLPLGWKQRLAFSVSIFHEPRIVFLDEPTGGVDPLTRRQFWELIYQAADRGITVFVTTHYMDEADYCDRVSIMVDGQIRALDTPDRLRSQFHAETMYDVFLTLARASTRQ